MHLICTSKGPMNATRRPIWRRLADVDYHRYMASAAWQAVRQRWFLDCEVDHCEACWEWPDRGGCLDLHHRTYDNLGVERYEDLVAVCRKCHGWIHGLQRSGSLSLNEATVEVLKKAHFVDLSSGLELPWYLRRPAPPRHPRPSGYVHVDPDLLLPYDPYPFVQLTKVSDG